MHCSKSRARVVPCPDG